MSVGSSIRQGSRSRCRSLVGGSGFCSLLILPLPRSPDIPSTMASSASLPTALWAGKWPAASPSIG